MIRASLFVSSAVGFLAVLAAATPTAAAVTYSYGGASNPVNSRDGGIVAYIDQNAPITYSFTVATNLASNLVDIDIKDSILTWTASGQKAESTVRSSDLNAFLSRVRLSTDASGNIFRWNIFGSANILALPGDKLEFYFDSLSGPHDTLKWFNTEGQSFGGAASTQPAGNFVRVGAAAAVPETATWGMMIAGFGMMGASMRYRRRTTKLAFT